LPVVCSGDLTLAGSAEDFAVAHAFLYGRTRIARQALPSERFGLGTADPHLATVPGNHDQWQGKAGALNFVKGVPAYTPGLAPQHFAPTPWQQTWQSPDGSVTLELFGVDTNSGLAGVQRNYLQEGVISPAQFQALGQMLAKPAAAGAARAVVCHHSPAYNSYLPGLARLATASNQQLQQLARQHGVHAILCGHTHDAVGMLLPGPHGAPLAELRSASTTCAGQLSAGGRPRVPENGFLEHQLRPRPGGGWDWTCWAHAWDGARFVRKLPALISLPGP
jgi:3',5'-cyclic AMP phosphodiesterase CpdA